MAKVPLRKYTSEIETLIDRGQMDEAISHCRHILTTYPKHIETYRMLGKAYLEAKRYPEATDIFKRVLMAVPGDFVSHVGLSIIADEEKRADDAIWHMERAFEAQPSNAAIQSELQRLYGRRDGMEPPKIRLTRGALAHMYVQGELYAQAIGEIRSVIADDPNRTDMKALLALAYFRGGQRVEASETCTELIGRFPYCLDANRILMEILPGTGMAESIQTYRSRVIELDPYAAYTAGSVFLTGETSDSAVSLDRLDYKGKPVEVGPDWVTTKGISLGAGAAAAAQPEWMKSSPKTEPASPPAQDKTVDPLTGSAGQRFVPQTPPAQDVFDPSIGSGQRFAPDEPVAAAPTQGDDFIPEWMRDAGWGTASGKFDESASALAEEPTLEELPKADLPDWIKSMAPAKAAAPSTPSMPTSASSESDDTLDWLNKLGGEKPFDSIQEKPLEDLSKKQSLDIAQEKPLEPAPDQSLAGLDKTPDWLADFGTTSPQQSAASETLDWLSKLDSAEPLDVVQDKPIGVTPAEPPAPAPVAPPPSLGSLGTSAAEQDAAMLWLESLAAKQGAKSEELLTKPGDRTEKPPEWVEQAKAVGEVQPAAPAPEPEPVAPPAPAPVAPAASLDQLGTSAAEQDAAMLWLESLAAKQGAKSEELITKPEDRTEKPPEWVKHAKEVGDITPAVHQPMEEEPHLSRPIWDEKELAEIPPSEPRAIDQTGVWLREMEEKDEREEPPVEPEPAAWAGEIEFSPPSPAVTSTEPSAEADLPSWLRGLEERESTPVPPITDDKLPDWLRSDEREVPPPPEPTHPADWTTEAPKAVTWPSAAPEQKPAPAPKPTPEPTPKPVMKPAPEPVKKEVRLPEPEPLVPEKSKLKRTGMLPSLIDPNLALARDAMLHGKIPDALQVYNTLIRKGKLLEDITFDLKEALYRFPVEVSIWQVLGDAYMRANRLQDALDAYTKAEELLR